MSPLSVAARRVRLSARLAEKDEQLRGAPADGGPDESAPSGGISVVIGTSKLAEEHPGLEDRLTDMINRSYQAVEGTGPRMLQQQPVSVRLQMGDGGTRANRVLHVAFRGAEVVGCISSSFATLWTEPGVGHWGLLVVDLSCQSTGVGSALVAAAERRLAEECDQIHIEHDFFPGRPHSERLRAWYEKCGYARIHGQPKEGPPGSEFCGCRKGISDEERSRGRCRRLAAERSEIAAELAALPHDPEGEAEERLELRSQAMFEALSALVKEKGAEGVAWLQSVFQVVLVDVGPEGSFLLDLKNGAGEARFAEDPEADCTVLMTDGDFADWTEKKLDTMNAFWAGRLKVRGDGNRVQGLIAVCEFAWACR
uniref:N-acetyltransferase domain-containing protein n=1 Tax=Alexandrium catenella TaxID=2925 RepID=A0A7S1RA62_ALECA|mmetsp:Transcript_4836/g.13009  ORF Transcript_4836/g.13009 Transcript_4836/m.13009 type:complete len:368 (+) Transcript_4836:40-1143(+)